MTQMMAIAIAVYTRYAAAFGGKILLASNVLELENMSCTGRILKFKFLSFICGVTFSCRILESLTNRTDISLEILPVEIPCWVVFMIDN